MNKIIWPDMEKLKCNSWIHWGKKIINRNTLELITINEKWDDALNGQIIKTVEHYQDNRKIKSVTYYTGGKTETHEHCTF